MTWPVGKECFKVAQRYWQLLSSMWHLSTPSHTKTVCIGYLANKKSQQKNFFHKRNISPYSVMLNFFPQKGNSGQNFIPRYLKSGFHLQQSRVGSCSCVTDCYKWKLLVISVSKRKTSDPSDSASDALPIPIPTSIPTVFWCSLHHKLLPTPTSSKVKTKL